MARPGRLFTAYFVTAQVALSYVALAASRRFRRAETFERVTREKHRRNAQRIEAAIVKLRGLFIKVGQLISIMANFLPDAFREELERLQDQVPPRPYEDIEARLREELGGRGPSEVFAEFSREPVASASIGQVHRARLATGEAVAVKVQYPDIEEIVRTDLRALKRIFGVLRWFMPEYGFDTIYAEIREMVLAELDYRQEASAIERIAGNFRARAAAHGPPSAANVRFPRVVTEYSTARVLTTEWMEGFKVADLERLSAAGVDRRKTARVCVEAYCQQIFIDGLYHADPHPGNLLVQPPAAPGGEPTVVFLDFGATATVSEGMRRGMISFLQGAMTRDTTRIVAAMKEMGFLSRRADPEVFDRIVQYFHEKMRAQMSVQGFSLKDLSFDSEKSLTSLLDLRDLNVSLADLKDAFKIPKEWILLERTLLLLLGVCTTLDPEMNPTDVIQPYLERFLLGEQKQWSELVVDASREMALSALSLPGELQRFMDRAARGELEFRVRNLDENARVLYSVGQQLLWGMLAAVSAVLAVVFDGRGQGTAKLGAEIVAAVFVVFLFFAWLGGRPKRKRHLGRGA
ncbi:MAG TPA: AarF/UbiB family protein [Polyangia bacterium]|jgi:predicted unusual protein kinase regulating ubiquinone biosynthesis (AarF/ABC1/UbiB family)|nr:AarF/UbiB family protein [Polyangia bacterium]